jgi:transcriptional regulator with XRE-family HTH domain
VKELVAERIRLARLTKNLSQQNIADELEITVAAYSNIERGKTDISLKRLIQICIVLDINPAFLLSENKGYTISDSSDLKENYNSTLTQQVYMLIQEIEKLKKQMDSLASEILTLKNR